MRSASMSFLQDQSGLSISIIMSSVILILALAFFASTLHSCCLSRKAKKVAALERADEINRRHNSSSDNKPSGGGHINGGLNLTSSGPQTGPNSKGSIGGSTASTNSTTATANGGHQLLVDNNHQLNHLGQINGSNSDHSSDHSRQAKLDSMLPPNYNHYADRASLMMEQQQQLAFAAATAAAANHQDKLSASFGLPNGALMGDPMGANSLYQPYGGAGGYAAGQQALIDGSSNLINSVLGGDLSQATPDVNQSAAWSYHQQALDDYNYNTAALANYHQQQDQMVESAYGTAAMMAQQSTAYDNTTNQFNQSAYTTSGYHQQDSNSQQYQQEIVAAQQQMYGTLTRNGYNTGADPGSSTSQQDQQQHQQQSDTAFMSTNGLIQGPPPPPVESDYGTAGGRSGRLIREIIV